MNYEGALPEHPDTIMYTWNIRDADNCLRIVLYNGYGHMACDGMWRWCLEYRHIIDDETATWKPLLALGAKSGGFQSLASCKRYCADIYHWRWRRLLFEAATIDMRWEEQIVRLCKRLDVFATNEKAESQS